MCARSECTLGVLLHKPQGYTQSQNKRKLIVHGFDWPKAVGLMHQLMVRGQQHMNKLFVLTMAAYNLLFIRIFGSMHLQRGRSNEGKLRDCLNPRKSRTSPLKFRDVKWKRGPAESQVLALLAI